jgi:hypothetical protein
MKEQMDLGLPDNMEMQKFDSYIQISRKWFGWQAIFLVVFAIIWNAFLFSFYKDLGKNADTLTKLLPLIHVAAGIGISYYAIASLFNVSTIFVSKDTLEISHKPIPWLGNKRLKSAELKQIYVKEKIKRNNNNTSVTYEVRAILLNGKSIKIISGLPNSEQALYVEQEIERYIGIEDVKVKGEVG